MVETISNFARVTSISYFSPFREQNVDGMYIDAYFCVRQCLLVRRFCVLKTYSVYIDRPSIRLFILFFSPILAVTSSTMKSFSFADDSNTRLLGFWKTRNTHIESCTISDTGKKKQIKEKITTKET